MKNLNKYFTTGNMASGKDFLVRPNYAAPTMTLLAVLIEEILFMQLFWQNASSATYEPTNQYTWPVLQYSYVDT